MIHTFRSSEAQALFHRQPVDLPQPRRILRRLAMLDAAVALSDLSTPAFSPEVLAGGSHKGYHRIPLAEGLWLDFWWMDGDAYKVTLEHE